MMMKIMLYDFLADSAWILSFFWFVLTSSLLVGWYLLLPGWYELVLTLSDKFLVVFQLVLGSYLDCSNLVLTGSERSQPVLARSDSFLVVVFPLWLEEFSLRDSRQAAQAGAADTAATKRPLVTLASMSQRRRREVAAMAGERQTCDWWLRISSLNQKHFIFKCTKSLTSEEDFIFLFAKTCDLTASCKEEEKWCLSCVILVRPIFFSLLFHPLPLTPSQWYGKWVLAGTALKKKQGKNVRVLLLLLSAEFEKHALISWFLGLFWCRRATLGRFEAQLPQKNRLTSLGEDREEKKQVPLRYFHIDHDCLWYCFGKVALTPAKQRVNSGHHSHYY